MSKLGERLLRGQKFNLYPYAAKHGFSIALGPVTDMLHLAETQSEDVGQIIVGALNGVAPSALTIGGREPTSASEIASILPAVCALARAGIPPDIQEVLVFGNPASGIAPGALADAVEAMR